MAVWENRTAALGSRIAVAMPHRRRAAAWKKHEFSQMFREGARREGSRPLLKICQVLANHAKVIWVFATRNEARLF
jgi:hypothetical protein